MMGLNIVVLVKQVPDTGRIKGNAMKEDGTVNRAALPAIFNPDDMHALEAALCLKDGFPGTRVTVFTMGPLAAVEVLKEALFRGADEVALISDRRFAGADTLATSYALACAIREKTPGFDFVFCGRQAIDGDTAQVGPQTAEKLGVGQITCVTSIDHVDIENRRITATRTIDGGSETVRCAWPVLVTFTDEGFPPRPPSVRRVLAHKDLRPAVQEGPYDESYIEPERGTRGMEVWDVAAIHADPEACGLLGSPTKVKRIDWIVPMAGEIAMIENNEAAIRGMIRELARDRALD